MWKYVPELGLQIKESWSLQLCSCKQGLLVDEIWMQASSPDLSIEG